MNIVILKMVTVSTSHILPSTANSLEGVSGWFIYFYEDSLLSEIAQFRHSRLPKDLYECIRFVALHGCNVMCLDRDGEAFLGFLNDYSENWQA